MGSRQYGRLSGLMLSTLFAAFSAHAAAQPGEHWVSAWGSAQMVPEGANALPEAQWRDASLRQVVRLSLPARTLRVRLSNVFGTAPLVIDAAAVGLVQQLGSPDLRPGSARPLRFMGEARVMIPAGGEYLSDPVELQLPTGGDLAISLHFQEPPARQTGHPGSRSKSFLVAGQQVMGEQWQDAQAVERWYQIADVEVRAPQAVGALALIGDSITDGYGVLADTNQRWTDFLFQRLQSERAPAMGLVNTGIGGGRLLRDGLGPNAVARFERDVLTRAGVTHALVQIGVNDLGVPHRNGEDSPAARAQLLTDIKQGLTMLAERAHAQGICLIAGTVLSSIGSDYYHFGPENEADRQELNAWIRSAGVFDAVADFDAATRDTAHPDRYASAAESADGLHPGLGGRRAMAEAVPVKALRSCKWKKNKP